MNISLLSSLLATCGIGWAMVARNTMASASESHIPAGSRVTATNVPSKPYEGSKIILMFLPTFFSSIWNIVGGKLCSGIGFAKFLISTLRIKQLLFCTTLKHSWIGLFMVFLCFPFLVVYVKSAS